MNSNNVHENDKLYVVVDISYVCTVNITVKIYVNLPIEYNDKKCITSTKFPTKLILSNIKL
jgi:hypothetical protein